MRIGNQKTTIYNKVRALAQICVLDPVNSSIPGWHCMKSVRIRSYFGPHFPVFGLNRGISPYSVRMKENADQNNSEYGHFLGSVNHTQ